MKIDLHYGALPKLFDFAKELRKNETQAEKVMWSFLRDGKLKGYKFRRQHPIARYIVDFYCHKVKLAVEIDGAVHDEVNQGEYDLIRDEDLSTYQIKVIRFSNEEVLNNTSKVLDEIMNHLHPGTSP